MNKITRYIAMKFSLCLKHEFERRVIKVSYLDIRYEYLWPVVHNQRSDQINTGNMSETLQSRLLTRFTECS